jgi:hypothetical protein
MVFSIYLVIQTTFAIKGEFPKTKPSQTDMIPLTSKKMIKMDNQQGMPINIVASTMLQGQGVPVWCLI